MLQKILAITNISNGGISLFFMLVISLGGQFVSFARTSILARQFGLSVDMDAFNFSNNISSLFVSFVSAGIITVLIPQYIKKEKRKTIDAFITFMYSILAIIIIIFLIFFYKYGNFLCNYNDSFMSLVARMLPYLLVSNFLFSVTYVTTAFFQSQEKYNIPKIINFSIQGIILFVLIGYDELTILNFVAIISVGLIVNSVIEVCAASWMSWRYKPTFCFFTKEVRTLFVFFLPVLFSSGIYQISLIINSLIAAKLETGSLTALSYSSQISNIINAFLIVNLSTYCYPKIIRHIRDYDSGQSMLWNLIIAFHYIMCFIICCFVCVGHEVLQVLFERGHFDNNATNIVYYCSLILIWGQQINIIRDMVYRYFYALKDSKSVSVNSFIVTFVNILISIVLSQFWGIYGLILSTVFASFISLILILIQFNRKIGFTVNFRIVLCKLFANELIMIVIICIVIFTKQIFVIENIYFSVLVYLFKVVALYILSLFFAKYFVFNLKSIS